MGAFPEDHEIKASRLVGLWVAEGFLKPGESKSLEEGAEDCLKALVGRNLVSARALKSNGRPKRYGMHDLMRDLCLKKAEEQRFVHVKNGQVGKVDEKDSIHCSLRRVNLHPSYRIRYVYASIEFMSFARSFLCTGVASRVILSPVFFGLRLLRVLDIFNIKFQEFPTEILHIVNLRYLALFCSCNELPSDISRLWNLQTLVICSSQNLIIMPSEIWQMAELRHLKTYGTVIFTVSIDSSSAFIQEKLQTISIIRKSGGFFNRMPNIKNLGLSLSVDNVNLDYLHKLETLKVSTAYSEPISISTLRLPHSVRKLSLKRCKIPSQAIKNLCELPNLEVLKLQECELEGQEWDATEEEFCKLQFLLLERLQMVHWQADGTNFPTLRRLVIRGCSALVEIPLEIGDIPTLQTIELDECSPSLVASAKLIMEEQRDNCNDDLQLRI